MATVKIYENNEMRHLSRMNRAIEFQRKAILQENIRLMEIIQQNAQKLKKLSDEYATNTINYVNAKRNGTPTAE